MRKNLELTEDEATKAAKALAKMKVSDAAKADFLGALANKGETKREIVAFARVFRTLQKNPHVRAWKDQAIDVCGTGGDHSGSYNISTTVAFVLAAAEVPVFKHGNRSVTSLCGSADFLSANGIPLEATDELWQESLRQLHFAFFFAPKYNPAFKHVALARRKVAASTHGTTRTIFNLLGPILNPGKPAFQLVGVFSAPFFQPMANYYLPIVAESLLELGVRRGLVVHGHLPNGTGLDELSVIGGNSVAGVGLTQNGKTEWEWNPADANLHSGDMTGLAGGDATRNLAVLNALLNSKAPESLLDTICFNAGAALWIAEKANDLKSGVLEAKKLLTTGPVRDWLKRAREFFQDHKT
ncbi:MAG: anthranilate phosphoribosyltransferase [Opitutales bacterium]